MARTGWLAVIPVRRFDRCPSRKPDQKGYSKRRHKDLREEATLSWGVGHTMPQRVADQKKREQWDSNECGGEAAPFAGRRRSTFIAMIRELRIAAKFLSTKGRSPTGSYQGRRDEQPTAITLWLAAFRNFEHDKSGNRCRAHCLRELTISIASLITHPRDKLIATFCLYREEGIELIRKEQENYVGIGWTAIICGDFNLGKVTYR